MMLLSCSDFQLACGLTSFYYDTSLKEIDMLIFSLNLNITFGYLPSSSYNDRDLRHWNPRKNLYFQK